MASTSNIIIAILNCLFSIVAIFAIGSGWFFHVHAQTICQKALQNPLFITGVILFVISLLGLIGSCCKVYWILSIYLFLMFLSALVLAAFTIFAFVVTNNDAGELAEGVRIVQEYRHGKYQHWLRNNFANGERWDEIKSCMIDDQICKSLKGGGDLTGEAFYMKKLSPIESGCCKPPIYCGFKYKNTTYWIEPKSGPAVPDSDCTTWDNHQNKMCFNCKSCKRGFIANIRKEWRRIASYNVAILAFLIIVVATTFCAKDNIKNTKYSRFRGNP